MKLQCSCVCKFKGINPSFLGYRIQTKNIMYVICDVNILILQADLDVAYLCIVKTRCLKKANTRLRKNLRNLKDYDENASHGTFVFVVVVLLLIDNFNRSFTFNTVYL